MNHRRTRSITALAVIAILMTALGTGCPKNVTPHPNQLNTFDGQAYDRLTEAQAALNEAKDQYAAGKLPVTAKTVINDAGAIYNTTSAAWLTYRDTLQGKTAGDPEAAKQALLADLNRLAQAIVNLKALGGK